MAFSLFGKPFGYAAGGQVQAPRTANIADQHHKLAYINNEEEALLRARGGTGQAGPGGIPAFPPVKGKTQGRSNAGTGFSGGSSGGGGGGGGSDSGQANNPPPSGGNNNNSGGGGNPGDQASGGYGSGNSGGNAGSSPPSSTPSGPSQAEINEQNRINRERAQAEADRREAQDQAIRDQIERDRAAQAEADRLQRNRDIVAQQQQQPTTSFDNWLEQAQNVRALPPASTINNFDPYQVATTDGNAFNSAVEQSVAADEKKAAIEAAGFTVQGTSVKNDQGVVVGSISDPINKFTGELSFAGAPTDTFEGNRGDYSMGTDQQSAASVKPAVPAAAAAGIASVGTNYGYETNQKRLDKYKLNPDGYAANDTSKEARLSRARNGGMSETDNPRFDKDGNIVAAKDAKYLDAADMFDGGGPGRAGPEFQTKFQSVNNTWAGQEGDTGNIGSTLGITPTGSGRDPTGAAAFVDKGGILGALAGAVLGPNSYVPPNAATTPYDGNDHRADNDQIRLNEPPVAGPPVGAPTCPEGYRFDSATNACVLGDASNTDPYQPIITPYTPPPLSAYTPFQPNAPFQPNFQTPSYLPQMPVQQAGIMASTPTQRYLGTA